MACSGWVYLLCICMLCSLAIVTHAQVFDFDPFPEPNIKVKAYTCNLIPPFGTIASAYLLDGLDKFVLFYAANRFTSKSQPYQAEILWEENGVEIPIYWIEGTCFYKEPTMVAISQCTKCLQSCVNTLLLLCQNYSFESASMTTYDCALTWDNKPFF